MARVMSVNLDEDHTRRDVCFTVLLLSDTWTPMLTRYPWAKSYTARFVVEFRVRCWERPSLLMCPSPIMIPSMRQSSSEKYGASSSYVGMGVPTMSRGWMSPAGT